ncbi:DUF397 domain-containing protein [Streptomyces sp. NPDC059578]|uniref:DUF397 domain-containing protein n=1 Tax=Streptomyces sp. NPDC059578 TaxID=3346874 RepID=UPI00368DE6B0
MAASPPEPTATTWHRSSYSGDNGGNCVEWSPSPAQAPGKVAVRDSKRAGDGGTVIVTSPEAWTHLLRWTTTQHSN